MSSYAGYQTVSHGGRDIGYWTNFVMVLDAGVAVIVLSNYWGPDSPVSEVRQLALDLALEAAPHAQDEPTHHDAHTRDSLQQAQLSGIPMKVLAHQKR